MTTNTMENGGRNDLELKHLGFVRSTAINTFRCISNMYQYAKDNSGPLRSGLGVVEGSVTTVVGPVCEKFRDVPKNLLVFLDRKIDQASNQFDKHAPTLVKRVASQGWSMIQKASQATQTFVSEIQTSGIPAAASSAVKKSETYLSEKAVNTWFALNRFPTFRMMAQFTVPRAAQLSGKCNHAVVDMSRKGYRVFSYFPLVPVDKISKAFTKKDKKSE